MIARNAAKAYANIGIETGVEAASPARLVVMLYDGALGAIANAERHMVGQRVAEKGQAVSHAISIIDSGLRASLDLNSSPLAGQLEQLYEYMSRRLLLASVRNDVRGLQEVARLLGDLRSAWSELADANARLPAGSGNRTSAPARAAAA